MVCVPSSLGDAIDRLSILHIKAQKVCHADAARAHVARELAALAAALDSVLAMPAVGRMYARLKAVNEILWQVEDRLRVLETRQKFGEEFVQMARLVYRTNDLRASLKRRLNLQLNSDLVEVKMYASTHE